MDIKSVFAQKAYAARPQIQPASPVEPTQKAVSSFEKTLRDSEETAKQALMGSADAQTLVQALAETQLAVDTAVTVRNRVVEAYQEILRMPV